VASAVIRSHWFLDNSINLMIDAHRHQTAFLLLFAASLLVGWHPLLQTLGLGWQNDDYTHILLILPVSLALILMERQSLAALCQWDFLRGAVLLAGALALALYALLRSSPLSGDVRLSIGMLALVLSWIGAFEFCFGFRASRSFLFPLLFLLGLVPFPAFLLDSVIALLQQGSAWSAHALFVACGVPVLQQGLLLKVPGLTVQVAQDCSSIRSSSMLMVTALVVAQILLQSPWRKALVVAVAVPLSVAKNGLRIFIIAMLGIKVDPGYLTGRFHRHGGILFFIVALLALFAVLWILRRGESSPSPAPVESLPAAAATP
jgi:exosortase